MANRFTEISQIGIAVSNLDLGMKAMERVFGAQPDEFLNSSNSTRYYHGRPVFCSTKIAIYHFANIEIELIEPVDGEGVWQDFVREKGSGVQHIKFSVPSYDEAAHVLEDAGYHMSMNGSSARAIPGLKWAYFDTDRDLGFSLEIFNDRDIGDIKEK
ncbi:MAG: VOC family protein [Oscillospiraceae bacterium]